MLGEFCTEIPIIWPKHSKGSCSEKIQATILHLSKTAISQSPLKTASIWGTQWLIPSFTKTPNCQFLSQITTQGTAQSTVPLLTKLHYLWSLLSCCLALTWIQHSLVGLAKNSISQYHQHNFLSAMSTNTYSAYQDAIWQIFNHHIIGGLPSLEHLYSPPSAYSNVCHPVSELNSELFSSRCKGQTTHKNSSF